MEWKFHKMAPFSEFKDTIFSIYVRKHILQTLKYICYAVKIKFYLDLYFRKKILSFLKKYIQLNILATYFDLPKLLSRVPCHFVIPAELA